MTDHDALDELLIHANERGQIQIDVDTWITVDALKKAVAEFKTNHPQPKDLGQVDAVRTMFSLGFKIGQSL